MLVTSVEHHDVFWRKGSFAGWPANYGMWSWEREALVIFAVGVLGDQGRLHARDKHSDFVPIQSRSLDGGRTWQSEPFRGVVPGGRSLSANEHLDPSLQSGLRINLLPSSSQSSRIDFLDPEVIVMAARTGIDKSAQSWFYVSRDRGRRWSGPYAFTGLHHPGVAARTDTIAIDRNHALFMLSRSKEDGREGRCMCVETTDGGLSFSWKSDLPFDGDGYAIMPTSILLPDRTVLTVVRRGRGVEEGGWLEAFRSMDHGKAWEPLGKAVDSTGPGGNPGVLVEIGSGGYALVYGYRGSPAGIRMKRTTNGTDWSDESIIRADGLLPDLGYPRAVSRQDGGILTAYYMNRGEERFISSSTIFFA
ncbi:sialidase family protein [Rhizobium sp. SIMBA_035]